MTSTQWLLYPRGFLLYSSSFSPLNLPPHWINRETEKGWTVSYDPRTPAVFSETKDVLFLGHAVHVHTGEYRPWKLASEIASRLNDTSKFNTYTNDLCGRFVICYRHGNDYRLRADASGMFAVFHTHTEDGEIISSHPELTALQICAQHSQFTPRFLTENHLDYLPGRYTGFKDVYSLIPNTEVSTNTGKIYRFDFGPESRPPLTVDTAAHNLISTAHAQLDYLKSRFPIRPSLSAGLDSRTTLALLRDVADEAEFFTYRFTDRKQSDPGDDKTPTELAERFNLHMHTFHLNRDTPGENFSTTKDMTIHNYYPGTHNRLIAHAYTREIPFGLHIRSNIYESGAMYYRRHGWMDAPYTADANLYAAIATHKKSTNPLIVEAYDEYIETTHVDKIRNTDPLDTYFHEQRLGKFMQKVYIEGDLAHDVHTLVNHRPTIEAMRSVPIDDQLNDRVQLTAIKMTWPELLDIPINGKMRTP